MLNNLEKAIVYFEDAINESDDIISECSIELQEELTKQKEHFVVALEVMKKQVPQKPINQGNYEECPVCKECIPALKRFMFCGFCGQRLLR